VLTRMGYQQRSKNGLVLRVGSSTIQSLFTHSPAQGIRSGRSMCLRPL
jgi:hypothetical protein